MYFHPDGSRVTDRDEIDRLNAVGMPPAYERCWFCPKPNGHIQATGYDEAGRKQYLYHERWQQRQAERKFELVREFALELPKLRRAVTADLRRPGMPRERALACAVRLLDLGFFRVGSEVYAEENESFGLATVRREHVTIGKREVVFDFPAKSGQRRIQSIRDAAARRAIEEMYQRRGGPEDLLAYEEGKEWRDVRSDEINEYIHEHIGDRFTAKNFRTWHGTVLAAVELAGEEKPRSQAAAKRAIKRAVDQVSDALGNTPAVCRASYIDPRVLDRYRDGVTIKPPASTNGKLTAKARRQIEKEVIQLTA